MYILYNTDVIALLPNDFLGDLPSFLKNQVDSLTSHLRFCESQSSSQRLSTEMSKNLQEQRSLLLKQMNLVNDQILKYRVSINIVNILLQLFMFCEVHVYFFCHAKWRVIHSGNGLIS